MGQVSAYYADASVVTFSIKDWTQAARTLGVTVPRDHAPQQWETMTKAHNGAVVMADFEGEVGSSPANFRLIWNADGTAGPDNDGSPAMTPGYFDPAYLGFKQFVERISSERDLEEAKQTGHLLLSDGEVDAWHGVTPSGRQCHHRHRSPEAASECAARLQQQEGN
jgi:hypothetical protein